METPRINRRTFLKGALFTAGAAALAANAPAVEALAPQLAAVPGLPRYHTLFFGGQQWGDVYSWNPYQSNGNNSMVIAEGDNARVTVWETPYIYNMMTGEQVPLLADGPFTWDATKTHLTFHIKPAAKWSDGAPVTAYDVAYTWETHVKYGTAAYVNFGGFIQSIVATNASTVVISAITDESGKAINPLQVAAYVSSCYVIQKAWTQKVEARANHTAEAFKNDPGLDFVASGPYKKYYVSSALVALERNENYWGKDASMWGKLPAPRYLAHKIYPDNAASFQALKDGEVDVSQEYIPNVQNLWLVDHLPISTYMPDAPYGIGASLPTAFFNLKSYGLDQVAVRKAIAMAVDYDEIIDDAMTNQSPTFTQVPRSLMNPTPGEQALFDHAAVASLQWAGGDIAGAKALLDAAGIIDTDGDGYREYNGTKLSYTVVAPNGWTDWMAAVAIIVAAGIQIGIEMTALYPDWSEVQTIVTDGTQTEYDIFVMWTNGAGPSNPWSRIRNLLSSEFAGMTNNWNGNWGGYANSAVDALIAEIPMETDPDVLKEKYTQLVTAYLTDVPSFTLMYRPQSFHTVNEKCWSGFPTLADGKNIPPLDMTDGYGIAGLYELQRNLPFHSLMPLIKK